MYGIVKVKGDKIDDTLSYGDTPTEAMVNTINMFLLTDGKDIITNIDRKIKKIKDVEALAKQVVKKFKSKYNLSDLYIVQFETEGEFVQLYSSNKGVVTIPVKSVWDDKDMVNIAKEVILDLLQQNVPELYNNIVSSDNKKIKKIYEESRKSINKISNVLSKTKPVFIHIKKFTPKAMERGKTIAMYMGQNIDKVLMMENEDVKKAAEGGSKLVIFVFILMLLIMLYYYVRQNGFSLMDTMNNIVLPLLGVV